MIPTEVYELARAIGECDPEDEPDDECIKIAWEMTRYLEKSGFRIVRSDAQ